jgi:hypothetical protein
MDRKAKFKGLPTSELIKKMLQASYYAGLRNGFYVGTTFGVVVGLLVGYYLGSR